MSLATAALGQVEKRLPKVIDARTHGIIDYCNAAFFFGLAIFSAARNRRAATAALATGAFILAESLLTDYPLGAAKVLRFEAHGRIDASMKGWRRPNRERLLSDSEPNSGSMKESTAREMPSARPVRVPDRPHTAVR